MKTNPPGVEFVINILKFDKLNKRRKLSSVFYYVDVRVKFCNFTS